MRMSASRRSWAAAGSPSAATRRTASRRARRRSRSRRPSASWGARRRCSGCDSCSTGEPPVSEATPDRDAGSVDVGLRFLDGLDRWLGSDRSTSAAGLQAALFAWLRRAQAEQPSMALVHQLAARAWAVAESGVRRADAPAQLRAYLAQSAAAEREVLDRAVRDAARVAAELIPRKGAWIATLSASAGVRAAVRALVDLGRAPSVFVAESRPRLEGRESASAFAAMGVETWLVADVALPLLLSQAQALWLGADAVMEIGVLNKVGSFAAALAAREQGVPVWAIGVRKKFLPSATPAFSIDEQPAAEIWDAPPAGVQPRN